MDAIANLAINKEGNIESITWLSNVRTTFGIVDPKTGLKYPDIINAFLLKTNVTRENLNSGYLIHDKKEYVASMDTNLREIIRDTKKGASIPCIISLQQRTDIWIAIVRYDKTIELHKG